MSLRKRQIDEAAFGVIYGAITVVGVLAATDTADFDPLKTGLKLCDGAGCRDGEDILGSRIQGAQIG